MSKKFRTRGLVVKNNEIVMDELVLTYPGEHQAGGIGEFVNDEAYRKMLYDSYAEDIQRANRNESTSSDHVVFHIGKTVLQLILAQEGCEGIRITKVKHRGGNTFILESLSGEVAFKTKNGKIFNRSIKKTKNDEDPTRSEDIYGYTFADLYRDIKEELKKDNDISTSDFFNII